MTRKERKELMNKRNALVREILNLRSDYSQVFPEDIPEDVKQEMTVLRQQLSEVRDQLGA